MIETSQEDEWNASQAIENFLIKRVIPHVLFRPLIECQPHRGPRKSRKADSGVATPSTFGEV